MMSVAGLETFRSYGATRSVLATMTYKTFGSYGANDAADQASQKGTSITSERSGRTLCSCVLFQLRSMRMRR
jgi:hypothetical protein